MPKFKVNQDMEEETTDYVMNDLKRLNSTPKKFQNLSDSQLPMADQIEKAKKKAEKYSFRNSRKQGILEGIDTNLAFYSEEELQLLSLEIEKMITHGFDAKEEIFDKDHWKTDIGKREYLTKMGRKILTIVNRMDQY